MDSLIMAASRALAAGDALGALKRVALREDAPALALRGIAMAQLGDFPRARDLLRRAARSFGALEPIARARCLIAEAEIALVTRDLSHAMKTLSGARETLETRGDKANAAHAGYLEARWLLLVGKLDASEQMLSATKADALPPASRAGFELVAAGIAIRRIRTLPAKDALRRAETAAHDAGIPALKAEVHRAAQALGSIAARLITQSGEKQLTLQEVEALFASNTIVADACRNIVRAGKTIIPLASRPILFALARTLAEAWPHDVTREALLARAFRAKQADESHRARLRVEIGRLRKEIQPLAELHATERGFVLSPHANHPVAVLVPPMESEHADIRALLADGEAWPSSALALALGVSPRTTQRALETLAEQGKAESFSRGRTRRWIAPSVPGFPTSLLLPALPANA